MFNTATGVKYRFECNQWFGKKSEDKKYWRDIPATKKGKEVISSLASVKYQIVVYTGDVLGAGTDANVHITIYGANGDSGKRILKSSWRDTFEQNQIDNFEIECLDLGEIEKVRIELDNKCFKPYWFLDKVEIINLGTNEKKTFPCQQWFDKKRGDGAISRELLPVD